jgi:hypothetical protein
LFLNLYTTDVFPQTFKIQNNSKQTNVANYEINISGGWGCSLVIDRLSLHKALGWIASTTGGKLLVLLLLYFKRGSDTRLLLTLYGKNIKS